MKFRSIIWTFILFSVLHLSLDNSKTDKSQEIISEQELAQLSVDSVYNAMNLNERINLLSVDVYDPVDSSKAKNDSLNQNGVLFNPINTNLKLPEAKYFENEVLRIAKAVLLDSEMMNRMAIGQTGIERLAFFAQSMEMEAHKKSGANIVLGSYFQTLVSKWDNGRLAFQESPLNSEKYWVQVLMAAEENGMKIGLHDFFFKDEEIDESALSEFAAIRIAGNRYYARKGHGIVQLNDELTAFNQRFSRFNSTSRQSFLRKEMDFKGIIISEDFSDLPAEEELNQAFKSLVEGSDLICISSKNKAKLNSLLVEYFSTNQTQLKERCSKILRLKYDLHKGKEKNTSFSQYKKPFEYQVKQAALVSVKSDGLILPINKLTDTISYYTSEENSDFYEKEIGHYSPFNTYDEKDKNHKGICILDGFGESIDEALRIAINFKGQSKFILLTDAKSFYSKRTTNYSEIEGILLTADTTLLDKSLAIQSVFGAFSSGGELPYYHTPRYPQGYGLGLRSLNRLKYIAPEYFGINTKYLDDIDHIAENGIDARAYPGCQIIVGYDGQVIYEKNFGHLDYSKDRDVKSNTIYDIASISKIAASTVSLMALQGQGKFSLNDSLYNLIPEVVGDYPMKDIWLKDMMAHQAGLPAWIPFYLKTLDHGQPSSQYYSNVKRDNFTLPVAKDLWIREDYRDTLYARILSSDLKGNSYKYSDLGYYFVKKIIEKKSGQGMDAFVKQTIYQPLGLQTMMYNPYLKFPLSRIAPTENDKTFRKQTIHGYVHDPGSAMMGGIGGHAGIFCTANDLAILMQMLLNDGSYGGNQILKPEIIREYTGVQFPGRNRRGAGFDKPNLNGSAATACSDASPSSYGHSGFTGTVTWADPTDKINYVFLSNRINPSAENWKIVNMNIRTNIQTKIYQSVRSARNYNFLASI